MGGQNQKLCHIFDYKTAQDLTTSRQTSARSIYPGDPFFLRLSITLKTAWFRPSTKGTLFNSVASVFRSGRANVFCNKRYPLGLCFSSDSAKILSSKEYRRPLLESFWCFNCPITKLNELLFKAAFK